MVFFGDRVLLSFRWDRRKGGAGLGGGGGGKYKKDVQVKSVFTFYTSSGGSRKNNSNTFRKPSIPNKLNLPLRDMIDASKVVMSR